MYVGLLILGVAAAIYLEERFGIPDSRAISLVCGAVFLLASTRRPWWLFATIRRLGWFALIQRDTTMRRLLLLLGIGLLLMGALQPTPHLKR